jgi:RNA polymerase sigma-70 factor (ECF subfamily)
MRMRKGRGLDFVDPFRPWGGHYQSVKGRVRAVTPVADDDATLVDRARRGDDGAFAALYRRHARYVAGVAYRILGSDGEVDDVVQETFVDAANGLSKIEDPARLRGWLAAIAVRRVHRRLARRARMRWLGLELGRLGRPFSEPKDRERVDALYETLDRLSPKLRVPWVLSQIEGESLPEVARLCDVSLATVKRRVARAEERIRRLANVD